MEDEQRRILGRFGDWLRDARRTVASSLRDLLLLLARIPYLPLHDSYSVWFPEEFRMHKHANVGSLYQIVRGHYSGVIFELRPGVYFLQQRDNLPDIADPGLLSIFGGTAVLDESPSICLEREIREELGIEVDWRSTQSLVECIKLHHKDGVPVLITIYLSRQITEDTVHTLDVREGTGFVYVLGSAADSLLTSFCRFLFYDVLAVEKRCRG